MTALETLPVIDLDITTRLRPVVELEPGKFGSSPMPQSSPWPTEESERYWRACLAVSGITSLDPVTPGSWMVLADDLTAPFPLDRVLRAHFEDEDPPADLDEIGALAGGFAVVSNTQVLLLPSCCGDLGDLRNWSTAASSRSGTPEMLWIGHPWLSAWFEDGSLLIREEQEHNPPAEPRTFRVAPAILRSAISHAERELDDFRVRLRSVVDGLAHPAPDAVVERLVGGLNSDG